MTFELKNRKRIPALSIIWITFILELIVAVLFRLVFGKAQGIDALLVMTHICFLVISIVIMPTFARYPLLVAFVLRIIAMIIDCSTLVLSNTSVDTIGYYTYGVLCMRDFSAANQYGGMYSRILGVLFRIVGESRLAAEYINVLLGISSIILLFHMLYDAGINKKRIALSMWIMSVFPFSIMNSVLTYRETFISFFCMSSCFWTFQWYQKRGVFRIAFACISLLFASMFHAGIIVLAVGYVVLFAFYLKEKDSLVVRRDTLFIIFGVLAVVAIVVAMNPRMFLGKFMRAFTDSSSITKQFNRSTGGSAYLTGLKVKTLSQVILFSPIKAVYFLFSPLPTDWRGLMDVASFFVDSTLYLVMAKDIIFERNKSKFSVFVNIMSLSFIIVSLVFGIGTWNAGTAIRHRNKIVAPIIAVWVLSKESSIKKTHGKSRL